MFFTTSCQAELTTRINCDLAVTTVLWLLSLTPETSLLDSCLKTCISLHKLILNLFTLILYIVAFCQLFIKDMMDGWNIFLPSSASCWWWTSSSAVALVLNLFTLKFYTVAFCQLFIKDMMDGWTEHVMTVHYVDNNWQHQPCDDGKCSVTTAVVWRHVEQDTVLIFIHFTKPNASLWRQLCGAYGAGHRYNFSKTMNGSNNLKRTQSPYQPVWFSSTKSRVLQYLGVCPIGEVPSYVSKEGGYFRGLT